jgi:hypothetical protein
MPWLSPMANASKTALGDEPQLLPRPRLDGELLDAEPHVRLPAHHIERLVRDRDQDDLVWRITVLMARATGSLAPSPT